MNRRKVTTQEQLEDLLSLFDWAHGFVREVYLLSPSYIARTSPGVVAADSPARLRMLLTFADPKWPGVEFLFEELHEASFRFSVELRPSGQVITRGNSIQVRLEGLGGTIVAEGLSYEILDESCWGDHLRYGNDQLMVEDALSKSY